tara:strand:- start:63 stop:656 length:594 start_codon:yes stop_codon:yes gene_type:complete
MALGTTKLQAVNTMLSTIGEAPVNSITTPQAADVAIAINVLDEITRHVQADGWDFNTECEYELTPDSSNEITLPSDTLAVRATNRWSDKLTTRGNKLYNIEDANYTWTSNVEVTLVRELDFEDMPEPAKQYVMLRAARIFRQRTMDDLQDRVPTEEEFRALADLRNYDSRGSDMRISDSYPIGRITRRPSPMDGHLQ